MESTDAIQALAALAHEGRLAIFRLLVRRAPGGVAAGEIAAALGLRASTLSNQMAELERAGLVRSERRGRSVLYAVELDRAGAVLGFLAADCCRGRPEACEPIAGPYLRGAAALGPTREGEEAMAEASATRVYKVLFLCTGNSARSIFAEAILNRLGQGRFVGYSAGSTPRGDLHPRTRALLQTLNFDPTPFRSKSWDEFAGPGAPDLDFVFTVCDQAANEPCPFWPGQPMTAHWGVPDPAAATGSESEIGLAFQEAYRVLYNRIGIFTNLPISGLDRLALQRRLDSIGKVGGGDASAT